jgi:hypothetical protein
VRSAHHATVERSRTAMMVQKRRMENVTIGEARAGCPCYPIGLRLFATGVR